VPRSLSPINESVATLAPDCPEVDSTQRYRLFFESGLAGVIQTNWDGRVVDCNDACAQIFGYASARELIGMPMAVPNIAHRSSTS
jgi:PAS domain S-box-containing protein